MPRRKPGTLVPLETEILGAALALRRSGAATFHGFGLAQAMREHGGSRALTGHGTLYKALGRLEEFGLLTSRWEDAAATDGRPRRRLYSLTGEGARVTIVGHTDTVGSDSYNQKLSNCRADAAKSGLVGKGVPADAISASGRGETELMVKTGDNVKEPQNRRATIDLD